MSENDRKKIELALETFNQFPHHLWWKDLDLKFVLTNNRTARSCGFSSSEASFLGIREGDIPVRASELAEEYEAQDRLVLQSEKQIMIVCFGQYEHDQWNILFGHKYPRYNESGELIGISGTGHDVTNCSVMRNLLLVTDDKKIIGRELNDLDQFTYILKDSYDDIGLTQRESECLFYLIRGKSAKETGRMLRISNRTVEKYIDKLKDKLNCNTKSEIVDVALHSGIGNVIPKSFLNEHRSYDEWDELILEAE